jgi:hypothetical protein
MSEPETVHQVRRRRYRRYESEPMTPARALRLAVLLLEWELEDALTRPDKIRYPSPWVNELRETRQRLVELLEQMS